MRNKSIVIVAVVAVLMLVFMAMFLFDEETRADFNIVFDNYEKTKQNHEDALATDYEAQRVEYGRLEDEKAFALSELTILEANLKNIQAEHQQKEHELRVEKTEEIRAKESALLDRITELEREIQSFDDKPVIEDNFMESSSDIIYSILLDSITDTPVDIVSYFANDSDKGLYTVKFVGYLDSLSNVLDALTENLVDYDVSVGNLSIRQIYACYSNMRTYDKTTLLEWFENQYVTQNGGIGSIEGGYTIDGVNLSGIIGADTIENLKAEKEKALAENNAKYDEQIQALEAERVAAIIEAYNGTDPAKVDALVSALHAHYDEKVAAVRAECNEKADAIAKEFDDRIAAIEQGIKDEEENFNLADPSMLFYTMDITFSVHND